ncbi:hypothetical protein P43SY_002683 [Pythium insidiosum]|uniref:HTH CENPB-type domain-containing protein n=1 Tax=Pythium insidiosum TaxID=114742 RepID=A0AAD5QBA2_PYTIN|nr:hypothetical protein P43SY_002683 [Pythium insidiosum]
MPSSPPATTRATEPADARAKRLATRSGAVQAAVDAVDADAGALRRSTRRGAAQKAAEKHVTGDAADGGNSTDDEAVSEETVRLLVQFVADGGSVAAAATRFNIPRDVISRLLKVKPDELSNGEREHSASAAMDAPSTVVAGGIEAPRQDSDVVMEESLPTATPTAATKRPAPENASAVSPLSSEQNPKPKRVRKSREEKLAILEFVDQGGTHVAAAEKFGVSRTAVTKMVKERELIIGATVAAATAAAAATATLAPAAVVDAINRTSNGEVADAAALSPVSSTPTVAASATAPAQPLTTNITDADKADKEKTAPATRPALQRRRTSATNATSNAAAAAGDASATTAPKKVRRVRKTNEEKLAILEFVDRGGSQGAAAEKFGVSRTAVTKMVKERDAISAQVHSGMSNHRKVLQYQHKLSVIEDMLYRWQVQVEQDAPNLKITGDLLQTKAMEFRDNILSDFRDALQPDVVQSLTDFKASNGWLHRYLQRRNLRASTKREDSKASAQARSTEVSAPAPAVEPQPVIAAMAPFDGLNLEALSVAFRQRLAVVPLSCIWNLSEIALFPLAFLENKPIPTSSSSEPSNEDTIQHQILMTLLVSASGEKFKAHVLTGRQSAYDYGRATEAAAFENLLVDVATDTFVDPTSITLFLQRVSDAAKARNETWYILLQATPSHAAFLHLVDPTGSFDRGFYFESLVLVLVPPPQSPGDRYPIADTVGRVLKASYRQAILNTIVSKVEAHQASMGLLLASHLEELNTNSSGEFETVAIQELSDALSKLSSVKEGAVVRQLGFPTLGTPSDRLNMAEALTSFDDHLLTATPRMICERLSEACAMLSSVKVCVDAMQTDDLLQGVVHEMDRIACRSSLSVLQAVLLRTTASVWTTNEALQPARDPTAPGDAVRASTAPDVAASQASAMDICDI